MSLLPSFLLRFLSFAVLWWILAEGVIFDVWFILAAVLAVTVASYRVFPTGGSWHFRLLPLLVFVPFFIWYSMLGGLDVARRALRPDMPLDPEFLDYPLSCAGKTRFLLAWVVSLLPGTASIALDGEILRVHLLDRRLQNRERIRELEIRLSRIDKGSGGNSRSVLSCRGVINGEPSSDQGQRTEWLSERQASGGRCRLRLRWGRRSGGRGTRA